jgi:hypothetical protein
VIAHDVEVPPSETVESFAVCLASVTELPVAEVPVPDLELAQALGVWRTWLAERAAGLVPIADPQRFQWAGWWIALIEDPNPVAALAFGTPPGVVLSPQAEALLGRAIADLPVTAGYAVASLDPAIHPTLGLPDLRGTVEAVAVAPRAEAPMRPVETVVARAGRGLDDDRYAAGAGTFSPRADRRPGYDLTLIAAEVLDELAAAGTPIPFTSTRRNVLTRGLDVNALVGRTFRIGDVRCIGRRLCEPCAHLERLSGPDVLRPLIHRGGLRVDVLSDGEIRRGARISTD